MILNKENFKKLAMPYCQNKDKKPKKYSNSYYDPFVKYLKKHNFENILDDNNFEKFFLEFCEFHFEDGDGKRLDFSEKIKLDLLKRSGGCCSICGTLTIFPLKGNNKEALNIGAACHIMPASAYGPRADVLYRNDNREEISSIENGLWACLNCHKEIDIDFETYTVDFLKIIKDEHEKNILDVKKNNINIRNLINNFFQSNNDNYIYINKEIYEKSQSALFSMYEDLKEVEKKSIYNVSLYKVLMQLKKKKIEKSKKGNMIVKIIEDDLLFEQEIYTNNSIELEEAIIRNEMSQDFEEYYAEGLLFCNLNSEKYLAKEISDYNKDFEIFIINQGMNRIIKLKESESLKVLKNEDNFITLFIDEGDECFVDIDYRNKRKSYKPNKDLKLEVLKIVGFIDFISDFNIDLFYILIRYENEFYKVPSFSIMSD